MSEDTHRRAKRMRVDLTSFFTQSQLTRLEIPETISSQAELSSLFNALSKLPLGCFESDEEKEEILETLVTKLKYDQDGGISPVYEEPRVSS